MQIDQADILEWAAQYDGEPYHALLCDPPYHLTSITERFGKSGSAPAKGDVYARQSRGFMNSTWDGGDLAFQPETWATIARVLHPGAFGMAFAGSRGWHRMAVAIEDAGLIIHPTIFGWGYGCLSEDTEILTSNGWEPYHKAIVNTQVLCYNIASGSLEWHRVQDRVVYEYDETAYHVHSQNTDQIVSRNHRCIVERNGRWVFEYAERLGTAERVPILPPARASWPAEKPAPENCADVDYVSCMRCSGVETQCMATQSQDGVLLNLLPIKARACGADKTICRQRQGDQKPEEGHPRRAQPGLEGWSDLLQDARQLCGREVCSLSAGVHRHGAQGWVCDGASAVRGAGHRAAAATLRSGTPQGSQPREQRAGQSATVRHEQRPQALRAPRGARPDLATVTPIHYRGKVWCVRVPTGAFVARRNGLVFITGNSGFPKATRLDTAIDRAAGAERRSVSSRKQAGAKFSLTQQTIDNGGFNDPARTAFDVTAPATDLAAAWEGHRYGLQALKPALEPIIVFQKPYAGRPVESITRTGAGAVNVDGGRIPGIVPSVPQPALNSPTGHIYGFKTGEGRNGEMSHTTGRWPANFALVHHPDCGGACVEACAVRRLGEQSGGGAKSNRHQGGGYNQGFVPMQDDWEISTGTAARFFFNADWMLDRLEAADPVGYYAKASSSEREAGLDPLQVRLAREMHGDDLPEFEPNQGAGIYGNETPEGAAARGRKPRHGESFPATTVGDGRQTPIDNAYQRGETQRRNIHPTIKPLSLARWLATLLLPPALYAPRRLLVPFAGTGSEMIGAMLAGWEHVQGVELGATHCEIARARLRYWQQQKYRFDAGQEIAVSVDRASAPTLFDGMWEGDDAA